MISNEKLVNYSVEDFEENITYIKLVYMQRYS